MQDGLGLGLDVSIYCCLIREHWRKIFGDGMSVGVLRTRHEQLSEPSQKGGGGDRHIYIYIYIERERERERDVL